MKTALDKVLESSRLVQTGQREWIVFHFEHDGIRFHSCEPRGSEAWDSATGTAWDFSGNTTDEVLGRIHPKTGKSVRDMLAAIPETAVLVWTGPAEDEWPMVPVPDDRWGHPVPLPPRTAFDVVLAAVELELRGKKLLEGFSFDFDGRRIEYWGRYYGYIFTPSGGEDFEFAGNSFQEMFADVVPRTGKAVWQMLDELPPDAVTVEFDPDWPVEPKGEETKD